MKLVNYKKLYRFYEFERSIKKGDFLNENFGVFDPPIESFKIWHNKYLENNNKPVLSSLFYWDSSKDYQKNQSELFMTVDLLLYFVQPFDFSHCLNWNPVSYYDKYKCHSEDVIEIVFSRFEDEDLITTFKFKRGNYQKINLHSFLDHIIEYAFNKTLQIEIKYEVSVAGVNYLSIIENQLYLADKYDLNIFEKTNQNIYFLSKEDFSLIPNNSYDEKVFACKVESFLEKMRIFEENLYFIKQFKKTNSIEYLYLLNADFESLEDKKNLEFQVLSQQMYNLILKKFLWIFI